MKESKDFTVTATADINPETGFGEIIVSKGGVRKSISALIFTEEETSRLLDIIDRVNS